MSGVGNMDGPQGAAGAAPLEDIVDEAIALSKDGRVTMHDMLTAWDDRSYGPLFVLLGFMGGTPLAIVPGAAAVVGIVIALLALQMALGNNHPWLPGWALKQSVSEDALKSARDKMQPTLAAIDRYIMERWSWFAGALMRRIAAGVVFALGLLMVPFDAIPFAVAAPAWTVVLFGVAITARDGLVMIVATAACAGIVYLAFRLF